MTKRTEKKRNLKERHKSNRRTNTSISDTNYGQLHLFIHSLKL